MWCFLLPSCSVSHILLQGVLGFQLIQQGLMRNFEKLGVPSVVVLGKGRPALEEFNVDVDGCTPTLDETARAETIISSHGREEQRDRQEEGDIIFCHILLQTATC